MIAWFARNGVVANLLLVVMATSGIYALVHKIPVEVFPDIAPDVISVDVQHRGATPAEVEESVVIRIEEAIQDLVGIKEITSTSSEGSGQVNIEMESGYEARELLDEVKNRIDTITTFPDEIEHPRIQLRQRRRDVITVTIAGELSEADLHALGEQVRDEVANLPSVTQVRLSGIRPYEIGVEVSESTLRRHGLTFDDISQAIRQTSVDLPAGLIRSAAGEILLRTKGQAYVAEDFERIVVLTRSDGTHITLGEIAQVKDGFEEDPLYVRFNSKPAVVVNVSRVGKQNAIDIAEEVRGYIRQAQARMPAGVEISYWRDRSEIVKARLTTLRNSAALGFIFVAGILILFLRPFLSFWVCVGIPAAFLGAIATMPYLGITINIISLFAFIMVLGIVVDDAIVTAENVYRYMQQGRSPLEASIEGTKAVALPVIFGVVTTMVAFIPLFLIEGRRGLWIMQIPAIVIPVLFFSLVESKLVLPAHLKHLRVLGQKGYQPGRWARFQGRFSKGLERFVKNYYRPLLDVVLERRYLALAVFVGIFVLMVGSIIGGRVSYLPFPRIQSERADARLTMPLGTPFAVTESNMERIEKAAEQIQKTYRDPESGKSLVENILSVYGGTGPSRGGQSHLGEVTFEIVSPEERSMNVTSSELVKEWRELIGPIAGVQELSFRAEIGGRSDPINIQLTGSDFRTLSALADSVKERLAEYSGVFGITDTYQDGKQEVKLAIKPEAELLGLTMADLARQVRHAFYGQEAQRIPRGRDDVRVMVRYPREERESLESLENMKIRTPAGVEVPFSSVAEATMGRSFSRINRVDRNRTINVRADVDKGKVDLAGIQRDLSGFLPGLVERYPGINWSLQGDAREERESSRSLISGVYFTLFAIYGIMAIPFRSYVQPLIVMLVIPFGLIGAVLGHIVMGKVLSQMSLFGMLALAGVVVNDSLVLVHYVNRKRASGMPLVDAVRTAGVVRFRPIILTSLTTFLGLAPLIFEKSTQAQFLIPMAISLGFGILFATFITLLMIPINYLILEDIKVLLTKVWQFLLHLYGFGEVRNSHKFRD